MNRELEKRLDLELFARSSASSITFVILGLLFVFFQFGANEYQVQVIFSAVVVIVVSLVRYGLYKKYQKLNLLEGKSIRLLKIAIAVNALSWMTLFHFVILDIGFHHDNSLPVLILMMALCFAAIITLSPSPLLHLLFTLCLTLPSIGNLIYFEFNDFYQKPLFYLFILQILYSLKQAAEHRAHLKVKIQGEINLEKTNVELQNSKQEIIEQTAKTMHSSRLASLGEMAAGIAHEVNNPLAIIQGSLEQLERALPPAFENQKRTQQLAEKIRNSVHRIERIVRGLRTFSKQSDLNPMVLVNINSIIHDTLDFCGEKFRSNGIDLNLSCPGDSEIECRPIQISQILINLLNNAFDALEKTDGVNQSDHSAQTDKQVSISCRKLDQFIYVTVSNSGPQIPNSVKEKLFQPFFTTKELGKGTGLGLSISKNIAQHHGGDLYLDPSNKQTAFCLKLPLASLQKQTA